VDTPTFELFFSLLAWTALAGAIIVTIARFAAPGSAFMATVRDIAPGVAWIVALTATLGSLYFSEVANFEPCKLCWLQRVCMYPLALILGIAFFRRDRGIRVYAVPLAAIGMLISAYHVLIERYPDLDKASCSVTNPCTIIWFEKLGMTLPRMAGIGFLTIIAFLTLPLPHPQET
jgi:disulfide bond formation protein DsbB